MDGLLYALHTIGDYVPGGSAGKRLLDGILKMEIEGKIVIVTGGSSGIGLATAKLLSAKGAHVWLVARDHSRLQSALSQVEKARRNSSQRCGVAVADVTDIAQVDSAVAEVNRVCGAPDILINSAGDVYPCLFQDMDINVIHGLMELNYFGMAHVTRACLPFMIERRSGHIVNISSVYGFIGGYGYSAYCASKFAVSGFSDALRAELKPLGVGVSIVFPQDTATPQLERENRLKSPMLKALMTAEEVAGAIVRGIAKQRYVIIPGREGRFLYRLTSLLGGGTYWVMDYLVSSARKKVEKAGK
jgi:3-dehydrosphinganine reductase